MLNLIIKDILLQKKRVVFSILYIPLIIVSFHGLNAAVFSAAIVGFTYMLAMTSCAYEDMNKADIMINSLPVGRSKVVAAKYLSVLLYFISGTIVYIIITGIMGILRLPFNIFPVTLNSFIGGAVAVSMMSGIYLPLFFKVGYLKSRVLNFLLFFGFFFGFSALLGALQKNAGSVLSQRFINTLENMNEATLALLIAAAAVLFLSASFGFSVKFYKNREF